MAHGLNPVFKRDVSNVNGRNEGGKGVGSRRIFAPHFKLQVLNSYRNDADCKGNQRATARKYGIHRRQIQKWLQVENTLRNSVSNAKEKMMVADKSIVCDNGKSCNDFEMTLNGNRQQDDESANTASGIETRVPALSRSPSATSYTSPHLPLDYSIHDRVYTASPTVARVDSPLTPPFLVAPIDLSIKRSNSMLAVSAPVCCMSPSPHTPLLSSTHQPHPDVWDLSTKRKCRSPNSIQTPLSIPVTTENNSKPVKLFKPYLDEVNEPEETSLTKLEPYCPVAIIPSNESYFYNNNICDVKFEYTNTYTLHELQPKSMNCYYPPYPDYKVGIYCYQDISNGQNLAPMKQRQSYNLDFKLSAIDCYYQDSVCKGNQRAVATKYNIHRRQVQKWLKQAEELRLKNDSIKEMNVVR